MKQLTILRSKEEARRWVQQQRWGLPSTDGPSTVGPSTVGLVPTMGALHDGHFSLVRESVRNCRCTLATIFVNPTQFAPGEDLDHYPRTLEADLAGLAANGADAAFVPAADCMYVAGHSTYVLPPRVAEDWEGRVRPEHFRGVTTVVLKLFNILPATHAFFGQKDYQQAAVIRTMVRQLDIDIAIKVCPIVRDADGLALSSRNRYLSDSERTRALAISRGLRTVAELVRSGERRAANLQQALQTSLRAGPVDAIDYAAIVDPETLQPCNQLQQQTLAIVAARVGNTRLIDNQLLEVE